MYGYGVAAGRHTPVGFAGGLRHGHHGAPYGLSMRLPWVHKAHSMLHTNKKRLNALGIMVAVVVPWLIFCLVFALLSFSMHYFHPVECYATVSLVFFFINAFFGLSAYAAKLRKAHEVDDEHDPMWHGFLHVTCVLAILAGLLLGWENFSLRMSGLYDMRSLASYRDVDPAHYVGQQLVDAGLVLFNDNTHLDITKSMGFKNTDMYCVAPIVSNKTSPKSYVDFWAVGRNCCSGRSADFHCKGFKETSRMGGTRLMNDAARPFYRLAVQQAEAMYGITTSKPLFFVWGADPFQAAAETEHNAHMMYLCGIVAALCIQCFLVTCATLVFAKLLPQR